MSVKTVEFRDAGIVYLSDVERPTFIYDKQARTRIKYGNFDEVEKSYNEMRKVYTDAGFPQYADSLAMVEVEPNQELIDRLFQSSGLFIKFIDELENRPLN